VVVSIDKVIALLGGAAGWFGAGAVGVTVVGMLIFMVLKGKSVEKETHKSDEKS
jgi:hypothetical protein